MLSRRSVLFLANGWPLLYAKAQQLGEFDPLRLSAVAQPLALDILDARRQRTIPVLVYTPATQPLPPTPVLLFSHGLGGDRKGSAYLGRHWAGRGYVSVFLQHPGSDREVWENVPMRQRMAALRRAANARNFQLRVGDVKATLDTLEVWQRDHSHPLHGRLDLSRVGMAGHSFGAVTTQAVSGQKAWGGRIQFTDPRIRAAISLSPSTPAKASAEEAFGDVSIPWLLITGTLDNAAIGDATAASRLAVFPALPPGDKYELVLWEAEHSAFSDRPLPGDRVARNPNHHRAILAISTAFWDTHLRYLPQARAWLHASGPLSVLEPKDRWQRK